MFDVWKELIEARIQTTSWDLDYNVNLDLIKEISNEIHRRAPSKQNGVTYNMHWFDWSNPELRNDIYEFSVDRSNPDSSKWKYNSQVLANWVVVFTLRQSNFVDPDNPDLKLSSQVKESISHLEIGLAAHMLIHGAKARGLDCGFCRCFDYKSKTRDRLIPALNVPIIDDVFLILGVGKASNDITRTKNLYTNEFVVAESDRGFKWQKEPKPLMEEYIFYHV